MQSILALSSRILLSAFFLYLGFLKIFSPAETIRHIHAAGIPYAKFAYVVAVFVELLGGVLLLLGARTRTAALVLGAFLILTTYDFHGGLDQTYSTIYFLRNAAILGGLLSVAAFGGGRFSLDRQ